MFGKLLKHDFKAVFRYWWMLLPSVPAVCIGLGLAFRFLYTYESPQRGFPLLELLVMLFMIFAIIALSASVLVTPILSLVRFYKHLYTDEGYLTFTLPVRRSALLMSKLVNALIFDAMYACLLGLSVSAAVLIAVPGDVISAFFRGVSDLFRYSSDLFRYYPDLWQYSFWSILFILELILLAIAVDLFTNLLLYFSVTIGALIVKKAKLVVGLAIYYGTNTVLSWVTNILSYVILPFTLSEIVILAGGMSPHAALGILALMLLIGIAIVATLAFTLYSLTLGRLQRSLNLA